ncbi:MAG: 4Fe-4S binding protein [Bacillota bacterium]
MGAKTRTKGEIPLIVINEQWCKACGICIEFCPKDVFTAREDGKPVVSNREACIWCEQCELRCPDFAIQLRSDDDE